MMLGILPALLILYVRRNVEDPEVFQRRARRSAKRRGAAETPLKQIFRCDLLKTTISPSMLATGIQGGYYAMFTWIPTYLKDRARPVRGRHARLPVRGHRGRVPRLPDRGLRARPARAQEELHAVRGAGRRLARPYFLVPTGSNTTLLIVGFPLGFFASGCFSGFGSYLSELFPTRARGTGGGLLLQRRPRLRRAVPGHHRLPRGGHRARRRRRLRRVRLRARDRRAALPAGDARQGARAGRVTELAEALAGARLRPRAAALRGCAECARARAGPRAHAAPPPRAGAGRGAHERVRAAGDGRALRARTSTRSATRPRTCACTAASRSTRRCRPRRASPRSAPTRSRRWWRAACCSTCAGAPGSSGADDLERAAGGRPRHRAAAT